MCSLFYLYLFISFKQLRIDLKFKGWQIELNFPFFSVARFTSAAIFFFDHIFVEHFYCSFDDSIKSNWSYSKFSFGWLLLFYLSGESFWVALYRNVLVFFVLVFVEVDLKSRMNSIAIEIFHKIEFSFQWTLNPTREIEERL